MLDKKRKLKTCVDLTEKLNNVGITSKNFVRDGHFLEFMLLSSLRADGLSNLGYEFTDSFILTMGSCTMNSAFGYVQLSDKVSTLFGLSSSVLKLKSLDFKYGHLSLLYNLLYNIGIETENIKCFDVNYFTDISPSVSFTINRSSKYIRSFRDILERCLDSGEFVHLKGKESEICNESQNSINEKIDFIRSQMGHSVGNNFFGNINTNVTLGEVGGINCYSSDSDCVHLECDVTVQDKSFSAKKFGDIRVSVLNLGYNKLFKLDDIYGLDENERYFLQMQDDMKSGLNYMLGVIDAWTSLRNNRLSVFK